ncbi:sensor histidine kinase [Haloferax sulfurifontis]|uniref:histidine kinase n=1 Tax=Haloferax sulfurifontis ATCC BAA-897 TaxID=662480 RepID=M0HXF8_9EURY|nr:HAMP domain-containing sensor histidine kinase [Haloferax sulfurifontis]ELZ89181.1 signal-transducing histidine kinase-like protein [Haloferax sulfurifontis ATCC BAA-897]
MALIYAAFGFLWVATSDSLVEGLPNHELVQTAKGWMFVVLSALLVYDLVGRSQTELDRTSERLESTLAHTSVLHRILRHDIRNACTAILGYAELVESRDESDSNTDPVEAIRERANRLVEVSDEVALLRTVELAEGNEVDVDLSSAVADAVEDLELEHSGVRVSVASSVETLTVRAHPALPRSIAELLDNAVVHADCDEPEIHVAVWQLEGSVGVTVSDNGPGIPDAERDALMSGAETPLSHTSGVGLWLVRAIVDASGGSLAISTPKPRGTVVTVSLPRPA